MTLTLGETIKEYDGKTVSGYSNEGGQCGDLARTWVKNLTGDPYYGLPPTGNAGVRQFWYSADVKRWRKVAYEHGRVPASGALIIFDVGVYGHVGIAIPGSSLDVARSFDQNWSTRHICAKESHRYTAHGCLGWLSLQGEEVHIGPSIVQWAFALAYGKPWWQAPGFYARKKESLRVALHKFVNKYGYSPVESPNFFRTYLANLGIP